MNIRIPYEKLGNLDQYKFVSFILDQKTKTIFRYDFRRETDKDFFTYKKEFVSIPADIYEKCDSVIFFPFLSKNGEWGPRILMWRNEEFIKINGGYEFLRNSANEPDLNKIKKWFDAARSIPVSKKIIGNKNLIYFTIFRSKEYVVLLNMLLTTLYKQSFKDFELLFITDSNMCDEIKKLDIVEKFKCNYNLIDGVENAVDASMQKLKVFEWEKIDEYKHILFLDADVFVVGDVGSIFDDKKLEPNIFYGATHNHEHCLHKTIYHSLIDYTVNELQMFKDKNISAINAGQFFFVNTHTMQDHFKNINEFIKTWDGRYFFEQSFINYYFNLLEMADTRTFIEEFQFISINENECDKIFGPNSVFVHFMGNACNGIGKIDFVKKYYGQYVS
jgi:hypothetical protein